MLCVHFACPLSPFFKDRNYARKVCFIFWNVLETDMLVQQVFVVRESTNTLCQSCHTHFKITPWSRDQTCRVFNKIITIHKVDSKVSYERKLFNKKLRKVPRKLFIPRKLVLNFSRIILRCIMSIWGLIIYYLNANRDTKKVSATFSNTPNHSIPFYPNSFSKISTFYITPIPLLGFSWNFVWKIKVHEYNNERRDMWLQTMCFFWQV